MKRIVTSLIVVSLLFTTTSTSVAADKNPYGTATIDPAGPNEIILTVSKGKSVATFATGRLMKMKSSTISIYEPFLKKRQSFTVIPMKTFLSMVGIRDNDLVVTTALNDYVFSATAEKFNTAGAFIAIKRDGKEIAYDQGGPIRIIFSDKSKWAKYLDAWNWSISSITVK
jgi:hypothetical protein